jgi:hypothetical protein
MLENWIVLPEDFYIDKNNLNGTIKNFYSPIVINSFNNFKSVKDNVLYLIEKEKNFKKEYIKNLEVNISKSDYHDLQNFNRKWVVSLEQEISQNLMTLCLNLNFFGFKISGIWFQQYYENSEHGWHIHQGANYSGVFYLEMPEDGPKTEFLNTSTNERFFLNMNEGDIAIFPSFALHRSPKNKSKNRKTIVSFNVDFAFPDKRYKNYI